MLFSRLKCGAIENDTLSRESKGDLMTDFNWRKMSKLTFPAGVNETQYLYYEAEGKWTASDKERLCVMPNSDPAGSVAVLNAKMHPVNNEDRGHMIESLEASKQHFEKFFEEYGAYPQWKSEAKNARKCITRLEKEINRLRELSLP